jgi:hypothetical protein
MGRARGALATLSLACLLLAAAPATAEPARGVDGGSGSGVCEWRWWGHAAVLQKRQQLPAAPTGACAAGYGGPGNNAGVGATQRATDSARFIVRFRDYEMASVLRRRLARVSRVPLCHDTHRSWQTRV